MRAKTIIILLPILLMSVRIFSQQDPQFSQYMFNNTYINPGFAGSSGGICINGIIRQQWVGFEDDEGNNIAPETFLITADAPVKILRGGVSAVIFNDKIGFWNDIELKLGYTYRTNINRGNFGAGFQFAFINRSADFSKYHFFDDSDPLISELGSDENDMLFDFSLGIQYGIPDKFYVGVSAIDLLQSDGKPLGSGEGGNELKYTLDRSLYITGGYTFNLPGKPLFDIMPSFLIKMGQAKNQFDISTLVEYKDKFWGGISYRLQESVILMAGLYYKNFRIGYSYDINTKGLGLGGTHEISIGYCFKLQLEPARKRYFNTRFL